MKKKSQDSKSSPNKKREGSKRREGRQQLLMRLTWVSVTVAFFAVTVCILRYETLVGQLALPASTPNAAAPPSLTLLKERAEIWKTALEATALLVGGAWLFWVFVLNRTNEAALTIGTTPVRCIPQSDNFIVFFEVTFENLGKVKIGAQPNKIEYAVKVDKNKEGEKKPKKLLKAYDPNIETLDFSVSLLLRPIPKPGYFQPFAPEAGKRDKMFDWFTEMNAQGKPADLVAELNLIDSFDVDDEEVNFWIEPGETYHLPVTLLLKPGIYLGLITFIGHRGEFEMWRRSILLQVPDSTQADQQIAESCAHLHDDPGQDALAGKKSRSDKTGQA